MLSLFFSPTTFGTLLFVLLGQQNSWSPFTLGHAAPTHHPSFAPTMEPITIQSNFFSSPEVLTPLPSFLLAEGEDFFIGPSFFEAYLQGVNITAIDFTNREPWMHTYKVSQSPKKRLAGRVPFNSLEAYNASVKLTTPEGPLAFFLHLPVSKKHIYFLADQKPVNFTQLKALRNGRDPFTMKLLEGLFHVLLLVIFMGSFHCFAHYFL